MPNRAMRPEELKGAYVAIATPFEESKNRVSPKVNYRGVESLIERMMHCGINGVVIAGCTGYDSYMTVEEQAELFQHVAKKYGRISNFWLIAGDGANTTREAIELAQSAEKAGIFTHLSVSPYKVKPSDSGLVEHYREIMRHIEGNLILYSVPGRTGGLGLLPHVAENLANHPRIIGIKEASGRDASGRIERIEKTIAKTKGKDFAVISGDDGLTLDIIAAGGTGIISVAGNIAPQQVSDMVYQALKRESTGVGKARAINKQLEPLYSALFPKREGYNCSPNPVMCHYALRRMGFEFGVPPLPLTEGEKWEQDEMDKALVSLELI